MMYVVYHYSIPYTVMPVQFPCFRAPRLRKTDCLTNSTTVVASISRDGILNAVTVVRV